MQKRNYTRKQRRHSHFVLECEGEFLAFAKDGINYGFTELKKANAFTYEKALILKNTIKKFNLNILVIGKLNGKHIAL